MARQISKLILSTPQGYVFSRKKSVSPRKDGLLELLGGGADGPETPAEALRRELAEEEPTGNLLLRLDEHPLDDPITFEVDADPHYVFRLDLDEDGPRLLAELAHSDTESYGLELVSSSLLDNPGELLPMLGRFTPRTRRIFSALGWVHF